MVPHWQSQLHPSSNEPNGCLGADYQTNRYFVLVTLTTFLPRERFSRSLSCRTDALNGYSANSGLHRDGSKFGLPFLRRRQTAIRGQAARPLPETATVAVVRDAPETYPYREPAKHNDGINTRRVTASSRRSGQASKSSVQIGATALHRDAPVSHRLDTRAT